MWCWYKDSHVCTLHAHNAALREWEKTYCTRARSTLLHNMCVCNTTETLVHSINLVSNRANNYNNNVYKHHIHTWPRPLVTKIQSTLNVRRFPLQWIEMEIDLMETESHCWKSKTSDFNFFFFWSMRMRAKLQCKIKAQPHKYTRTTTRANLIELLMNY